MPVANLTGQARNCVGRNGLTVYNDKIVTEALELGKAHRMQSSVGLRQGTYSCLSLRFLDLSSFCKGDAAFFAAGGLLFRSTLL